MTKKSKKNLEYSPPHDNLDYTPLPIFYTDNGFNYENIDSVPDTVESFKREHPSVFAAFVSEQRRNLIEFINVYRKNHSKK